MKKINTRKGYDLEEIRVLRATNALRIDIEKERIRNMFSPAVVQTRQADKLFSAASNLAETVEYGIKTYRIVKKVSNLFRKKKN